MIVYVTMVMVITTLNTMETSWRHRAIIIKFVTEMFQCNLKNKTKKIIKLGKTIKNPIFQVKCLSSSIALYVSVSSSVSSATISTSTSTILSYPSSNHIYWLVYGSRKLLQLFCIILFYFSINWIWFGWLIYLICLSPCLNLIWLGTFLSNKS